MAGVTIKRERWRRRKRWDVNGGGLRQSFLGVKLAGIGVLCGGLVIASRQFNQTWA
jgi:hypothetical protein